MTEQCVCAVCGAGFQWDRPRSGGSPPRTCSAACRAERTLRLRRERHRRKRGPVQRWTCEICGVESERPAQEGRPPTVCSRACFEERARRRAKGWAEQNPGRVAEQPSRQSDAQRAANQAYYAANREREIQRSLAYARGPGRDGKRARDAARFALTRGAPTAELFTLDEIFERDGGVCHLCALPVDRDRDATVDHLIPVTRGGPHTRANAKLAHRGCNSRKGNRILAA